MIYRTVALKKQEAFWQTCREIAGWYNPALTLHLPESYYQTRFLDELLRHIANNAQAVKRIFLGHALQQCAAPGIHSVYGCPKSCLSVRRITYRTSLTPYQTTCNISNRRVNSSHLFTQNLLKCWIYIQAGAFDFWCLFITKGNYIGHLPFRSRKRYLRLFISESYDPEYDSEHDYSS